MFGVGRPGSLGSPTIVMPVAAAEPDIPQSGLIQWLKADTGTFSDAARTTAVTANGSQVKGWADQSGSANHASNHTAAGPVIKTAGQNGKVALTFSSHAMNFANNNTGLTEMDFFFVAKYVAASRILNGGAGSGYDPYVYFQNNLIRFDVTNGTSARGPLVDADIADSSVAFLANCILSTSQIKVGLNGVYDGTSVVTGEPGTRATTDKKFDANCIGRWENGTSNDPQCDLYEMIIYNRVVSAGERTSILAYLNAKYAIY